MVKGTATAKDAFRAMAADIISELYRIFVVKQITGFITSGIQSAFMPRQYAAPPVRPQATGGPVSAGSPYLVGERGPELMIPSRSGTIIPNNKLGGGGGVVVNQTINVSTGVQQTVRAEIKQLMPQIADSAKAAVVDAKRRGGSYGRAFA
jgi:phage-related minor tail protein